LSDSEYFAVNIIEVSGRGLVDIRCNPVILLNHDPSKPIGRCVDIGVVNGRLEATVEFPPVDTSPLADEVHGLVRHGAVSAVSVGFLPRETKPIPQWARAADHESGIVRT